MNTGEFVTTGDIARFLGWPLHKVTYAIQRSGIQEDGRAGTYRLFHRNRVPEILAAIGQDGQPQTTAAREARDG